MRITREAHNTRPENGKNDSQKVGGTSSSYSLVASIPVSTSATEKAKGLAVGESSSSFSACFSAEANPEGFNLLISNITRDMTSADIEDAFQDFGRILSIELKTVAKTGIVTFETNEALENAVHAYQKMFILEGHRSKFLVSPWPEDDIQTSVLVQFSNYDKLPKFSEDKVRYSKITGIFRESMKIHGKIIHCSLGDSDSKFRAYVEYESELAAKRSILRSLLNVSISLKSKPCGVSESLPIHDAITKEYYESVELCLKMHKFVDYNKLLEILRKRNGDEFVERNSDKKLLKQLRDRCSFINNQIESYFLTNSIRIIPECEKAVVFHFKKYFKFDEGVKEISTREKTPI